MAIFKGASAPFLLGGAKLCCALGMALEGGARRASGVSRQRRWVSHIMTKSTVHTLWSKRHLVDLSLTDGKGLRYI